MPQRTRFTDEGGAAIYIVLKSYLERLEALEKSKPEASRLPVPSIPEIAADVGVSAAALYKIAAGDIQQLNLRIAGRLIVAVRRRGFPMELTDLLALRE
jgi:hypothetical protein